MKSACVLVNVNMKAVVGVYDSLATAVGCLEATYGPGGLTQRSADNETASFVSRDGIIWSLAEHAYVENVASLSGEALKKQ